MSKRKKCQPSKLDAYFTEINDNEECSSQEVDIITYYRIKYYSILDTVIMNLEQRFSKESMNLANSVDAFLMFDYSKSLTFINHYKVS